MDLGTNLIFLIVFGLVGFGISKIWGVNPYRIFSDIIAAVIIISLIIAMFPAILEPEKAIEDVNKAIAMLKEVGNPRQLWQAFASLASVYEKMGRVSEAQEHWGASAETIYNTSKGLTDRELREGFLKAAPIREILSKAER